MGKIIKKSISKENKVIGNIKDQYIKRSMRGQRHTSISPSGVSGDISLAYYRGLAVGEEDTVKIVLRLLKKYPEARKYIKGKLT